MTSIDRPDGSDEDTRPFEQWLLDSARADELPRDVSEAWARFGASLGSASGLVGGDNVPVHPSKGGTLFSRFASSAALKWLALGALAGSALTLVWVGRARHSHVTEAAPASRAVDIASAPLQISSVSPPSIGSALALSAVPTASVVALAPQGSAAPSQRPARFAASSLGAQVALLDAARAALGARSFAAALSATDRYERQFPTGELRPDAEVVAIEALLESGNALACRERAARFLARYPADPHAARIKMLAARAGSDAG